MPHPIFGPPRHQLETIEMKLKLPTLENGSVASLLVTGECSTQRDPLWRYSEAWAQAQRDGILQPIDTLHWLVMAAAQDRPASQESLQRCLLPGGWEDQPLPF